MRQEKVASLAEGFLKWGWLILVLWAIFRYLTVPRATEKKVIHWEMVTYVGVLCLMTGVLFGSWAATGAPQLNVGMGPITSEGAIMEIDTAPLVGFSDDYRVVGAVVYRDPATDMYEDDRIALSNPFTITGQRMHIEVPFAGTKLYPFQGGWTVTSVIFIFPKDEDPKASVKRLSDVKKYHGILYP